MLVYPIVWIKLRKEPSAISSLVVAFPLILLFLLSLPMFRRGLIMAVAPGKALFLNQIIKKMLIFLLLFCKNMLWVIIRSTSIRRPTTCFHKETKKVFVKQYAPNYYMLVHLKTRVGKGAILLRKLIRFFFSKVNQVIYSSAQISSLNFKALAQIFIKISCAQERCDEGRIDELSERQMNDPKAICPSNLFKDMGIKREIQFVYLELWLI